MAYISRYSGQQVDDILAWAVRNKGIQIDTLLEYNPNNEDGPTSLEYSLAIQYNLILVHGFVLGSRVPNQGMLIFDPNCIKYMEKSPPETGAWHGVFSSTVWRGTPGGDDGAPIAIEVYRRDQSTIAWVPCYDIRYDSGPTYKQFRAQSIIGIRSITEFEEGN